mmetsp:Transcript_53791/g.116261  ORF Transcript_53791/g.116261 Transcript_53791/m.116261 type:complete len:100 (-) Transcript_53791:488-787(-)
MARLPCVCRPLLEPNGHAVSSGLERWPQHRGGSAGLQSAPRQAGDETVRRLRAGVRVRLAVMPAAAAVAAAVAAACVAAPWPAPRASRFSGCRRPRTPL